VQDALQRLGVDFDIDVSRTDITGQESTATVAVVLDRLGKCDLIIDATAESKVFNLLTATASVYKKPLVWLEIYGSGFGGMIARCRPELDPAPQMIRAAYLGYCEQNPAPKNMRPGVAHNYGAANEEGEVLSGVRRGCGHHRASCSPFGVEGVRVRSNGIESRPTDQNGCTVIIVSRATKPGTKITVELVGERGSEWVRIDPDDQIRVPSFDVGRADSDADINVMRRGDPNILRNRRAVFGSAQRILRQLSPSALARNMTWEQREAVLVAEARRLKVPAGKLTRVLQLGLAQIKGPTEQARIRLIKEKFSEALPFAELSYRQKGIEKTDSALILGLTLYNLGRYLEATKYYQEALNDRSHDYGIMTDLSLILIHLGDYQKAKSLLKDALALVETDSLNDPVESLILSHLGWVVQLEGNFDEAKQDYDRAFAIATASFKPNSIQ